MRRRLQSNARPLRKSKEGKTAWAVGVRFGYWPCMKAPFVQITTGHRVRSLWLSATKWDGVLPDDEQITAHEMARSFPSYAAMAEARHEQRQSWRAFRPC